MYSKNHRKHTHTIYGQNKEIFNVVESTIKNHCAFKSLSILE